jgi:hypothetical protein
LIHGKKAAGSNPVTSTKKPVEIVYCSLVVQPKGYIKCRVRWYANAALNYLQFAISQVCPRSGKDYFGEGELGD